MLISAQAKQLENINFLLTFKSTLSGITYEIKAIYSSNRQLSVTSITKNDGSSSKKEEVKVAVDPPQ